MRRVLRKNREHELTILSPHRWFSRARRLSHDARMRSRQAGRRTDDGIVDVTNNRAYDERVCDDERNGHD